MGSGPYAHLGNQAQKHKPRREARVALAAESDQVFAEQSLFAVRRKGSSKHTKCMSPRFFCTDGPMIGSLKPTQLSLRAVIYSFRPYSSIGRRKNPFSSVFQETPRHRTWSVFSRIEIAKYFQLSSIFLLLLRTHTRYQRPDARIIG